MTAGLFTLVFMAMMLSIHPVAAAVLLALAGLAGLAVLVDRERARREARAARADHAYRTESTSGAVLVHYDQGTRSATVRPHTPRNPAPWHLITQLPTQPLGGTR